MVFLMYIPKQHQIEGAKFLSLRKTALLADEPRVGKTGAAIMAADMINARTIVVVTTASGRPVWRRAFDDWSMIGRDIQVLTGGVRLRQDTEIAIIGWPDMNNASATYQQVWKREWSLLILDESHYAKSFDAQRTVAAFDPTTGLHKRAERVWCLSGTPMPNSPYDVYPMLSALGADRLEGEEPVNSAEAFKRRFCKIKPKKIGFHRWIDVIIGGQNLDDLKSRMAGFYLQRTQKDIGITEPIYDTLPLVASPAAVKAAQAAERNALDSKILAKIEAGDLSALKDDHMGPVRRIWGELKVKPLVAAISEEFEGGLDKIVIAAWHGDVMDGLAQGLAKYGVTMLRGSTAPKDRENAVKAFQTGKARVFIGQIQAAGEAIDLSSSAELIFAEASFVPKDMKQMALRITNHGQTRQPRVRVATLEGSIDEALQTVLMRKWATINEVMK